MPLWITLPGTTTPVSFETMITLGWIMRVHKEAKWHFNQCGCCITAHTPEGDYLVSDDGNYDFYPTNAKGEGDDPPLVI